LVLLIEIVKKVNGFAGNTALPLEAVEDTVELKKFTMPFKLGRLLMNVSVALIANTLVLAVV